MLPPVHTLDPGVRSAFTNGNVRPVTLQPGTMLYRFSGWDIIDPNKPTVSAWWSEASGLLEVLLAAKASGKSLEQFIRNRSAVLRAWNSIKHLVLIRLIAAKDAYQGSIAFQNEAKPYMDRNSARYKQKFTKPVRFGGGGKQVWIPDLYPTEFSIAVPMKTIRIEDDVDAIIDFLVSYRLV